MTGAVELSKRRRKGKSAHPFIKITAMAGREVEFI